MEFINIINSNTLHFIKVLQTPPPQAIQANYLKSNYEQQTHKLIMLFATVAALSSLSALALAAPTPRTHQNSARSTNNGTLYLYSSTGGAEPTALNGAVINANSNGFYINGLPTGSYCPYTPSACPAGNTTVLSASGTGSLAMDVEVPGGQQVYISPDGSLNYTTGPLPDSTTGAGYTPRGIYVGWTYTSDYGEYTFGSLTFSQNSSTTASVFDFLACPTADDGYAVKAPLANLTFSDDCVKIGLITYVADLAGPASWQYNWAM